jgi:aminopeptidase N
MEYLGADTFDASFGLSRQFLSTDVVPAMEATMFGASRPLVPASVASSEDIEALFDGVSYSFGGALLRMIEGFVERVRPGSYYAAIRAYMTAHALGSATPAQLWDAFGQASTVTALPAYLEGYTSG